MDIQSINQKHNQAMELAGLALLAQNRGQYDEANRLFRQAYTLEREVAEIIAHTTIEPTRSVIHRSAATLALDCGETREAEKLIAVALSGDPPENIAQELRDLLRRVLLAFEQRAAGD